MAKRGKTKSTRKKKPQQLQTSSPPYSYPNQQGLDFTSTIPDHLLSEIMFLLPDQDSLQSCSLVSKRWHSIINAPGFLCQFVQRRRQEKPSSADHYSKHPKNSLVLTYPYELPTQQHHHQTDALNFHHLSYDNYIAATCGDLAVTSANLYCSVEQYWVGNLALDEWLDLPEAPVEGSFISSTGIVSRYRTGCREQDQNRRGGARGCNVRSHFSYKVVIMTAHHPFTEAAAVYCSESHAWTKTAFAAPPELPLLFKVIHPSMVAGDDGILRTLAVGMDDNVVGAVAVDPYEEECYFIPPPSDLDVDHNKVEQVRLGAVGGRVRMSHFVRTKKGGFDLMVWELGGRVSWSLVHHARVHKKGCDSVVFLAFDPSDGDAAYFVRDGVLCRHRIRENKLERCCRITYLDGDRFACVPECLRIFSHPPWFTPPYMFTLDDDDDDDDELEIESPELVY